MAVDNDKAPEGQGDKPTDDKLGDAGKKALEAERRARKEAEAELVELRKFKAEVERDRLITEIASEKGLTPEMREALAGETREELEAHAEKLKALIPKPAPGMKPREAMIPGASNVDDKTVDASKIVDGILGD